MLSRTELINSSDYIDNMGFYNEYSSNVLDSAIVGSNSRNAVATKFEELGHLNDISYTNDIFVKTENLSKDARINMGLNRIEEYAPVHSSISSESNINTFDPILSPSVDIENGGELHTTGSVKSEFEMSNEQFPVTVTGKSLNASLFANGKFDVSCIQANDCFEIRTREFDNSRIWQENVEAFSKDYAVQDVTIGPDDSLNDAQFCEEGVIYSSYSEANAFITSKEHVNTLNTYGYIKEASAVNNLSFVAGCQKDIGVNASSRMINDNLSLILAEEANNSVLYKSSNLNVSNTIVSSAFRENENRLFSGNSVGNMSYRSSYENIRDLAARKIKNMISDSIDISDDSVSIKSMIQLIEEEGFGRSTILCVVNLINVEGDVHRNTINLFGKEANV